MDRNTAQLLARAGHAAPSADNSQPCCFSWNGDKLEISYDATRVAGRTFAADSPATLLSVGGVLENIARIGQACGLNVALEFPATEKPAGSPYARITVEGSAAMASPLPELPLFARHSNRFPYDRARKISDKISGTLGHSGAGESRLQFFHDGESIATISQLAQRAAEIRFQTRENHESLASSLRFSHDETDIVDGMDIRTLYLPPGGAGFLRFTSDWRRMRVLNRLGAYKFLAGADSKLLKQSPLIIAVTGRDSYAGAIRAGRLLCRSWTELNAQGLAVHPYYVVADQISRLREGTVPHKLLPLAQHCLEQSGAVFKLAEGETLYMLLRVGYARRAAPRSRRLPLDRVFNDMTGTPEPG